MEPTEPILVTGATGFVGSHIARRLAALGAEVHVFVRKTSHPRRLKDVASCLRTVIADVEDPAPVREAVRSIRPRTIFHCAAFGGHSREKDPEHAFRTNCAGTFHLLSACAETGFDRFLHTGSSSEYGPRTTPMTEEGAADPLTPYGASKAAATLWCRAMAVSKELPVVILRLFSPYGPMDDPDRLIPAAARAFLEGRSPELSSPEGVRDYVYIDDVVEAFLRAAVASGVSGEIINIGSGRQHSVREVVALLYRITGSGASPRWNAVPPRAGSPVWIAEIRKAKRLLAWEPRVPLEEGLRRTVEWMKREAL